MMEWWKLLKENLNLVIQASRDHGKSWLFSYGWPLFLVQRIRGGAAPINIALISYSEEQAKKNLVRIRKAIESRPALKWLQPKLKSYTWDSGLLNCSNDCTIEAFGFGSSIRGGHYHLVLIDDPSKDHGTMSLEEQENFFYGVILPAVRRGGQIAVIGTPVGKKDIILSIESNSEFESFKFPCWDKDFKPLWPEQYRLEDLRTRQRQMPTHIFAREYMLLRVSAEDAKFKEEWIKYYEARELVDDKTGGALTLYKIMTIDPAISPGGDALAAVVTGTDSYGNTYVLDRMGFRGAFQDGVAQLCEMMQRNQPEFIGIETFAFQRMYKTWLEEELRTRRLTFHIEELGRDTKKSKAMRIESLQPKIHQGRLFFRKDEDKPIVDQLLLWDPLSKHNDDDEIDALAYQVPLWRGPFGEEDQQGEILPGSFNEAFEQLRTGHSRNFIDKLFSDMRQ